MVRAPGQAAASAASWSSRAASSSRSSRGCAAAVEQDEGVPCVMLGVPSASAAPRSTAMRSPARRGLHRRRRPGQELPARRSARSGRRTRQHAGCRAPVDADDRKPMASCRQALAMRCILSVVSDTSRAASEDEVRDVDVAAQVRRPHRRAGLIGEREVGHGAEHIGSAASRGTLAAGRRATRTAASSDSRRQRVTGQSLVRSCSISNPTASIYPARRRRRRVPGAQAALMRALSAAASARRARAGTA